MSGEFGYNEEKAVEFIRNTLPDYVSRRYTDDEILYVIDIIWDYYEKNGFTSLNNIDTEDELLDFDDLMKYVKKTVAEEEEMDMNSKDLNYIVKGELDYEVSIENIF